MSLGLAAVSDIAHYALDKYVKGKPFAQNLQERPLLRHFDAKKEFFPSGKENISIPVKGNYMSSTAGFFVGYTQDEALTFKQASTINRALFPWKEHHSGFILSWTTLKQDGISIVDGGKTSEHSKVELTRLTGILKTHLEDFGESWAIKMNDLCWADGSGDSETAPGLTALLTATPTTGSTGGISRVDNAWWRHRQSLAIAVSESNQTLTKKLRSEHRQLTRFGGKPDKLLAGSLFIEALESEVQAKGMYTMEGFRNEGKNDIGMADILMRGVGRFEYDPSLDSLGQEKYCYFIDSRRIKMQPMEGEHNKVINPERPYNYFVFLKSMTWTGGFTVSQLNGNGVYSIS